MKNRLIFGHLDFTVILSLVMGLFLPIQQVHSDTANTPKEPMLGYQDTQIIVGSAAQVLLKQNTSSMLLDYCATKFKHLYHSAHSASQKWQEKHAAIISKANDINRYVANSIETHGSSFEAEKFYLKIDLQVHDSALKFKTEFASKNRKQQHYLCNRLILSTEIGDGDLAKMIPEHYQRVNEFKLKE